MKKILQPIIHQTCLANKCIVLMAWIILGMLSPLQAQLTVEGSMEGGFPMKYTITGISSNDISTGGIFGNIRSIAAGNVKFPVTMSVSISCTTPEYVATTCDKYRLCYLSQFQPGSYNSKAMSDGGNSYRVTINESDLVEDTIWGDYSAETAGKRVRVKKYVGAIYVLPELYDLSEAELQEAINDGMVNSRGGLAASASTGLQLAITIPLEILGEKNNEVEEDPDRVAITVTAYEYDSIANKIRIRGNYRSKTKITSATILRSMGGTAVQGSINYSNNSFVAECAFEKSEPNQFKIIFDNEAQLSAEQTITVNADGTVGSQTTTDPSGNTTVDVPTPPGSQPPPVIPGLGPVGNLPGPESIIQGIIGVVVPGLVGVLGGLLSGLLGGGGTVPTVPPVVPQVPKPPLKKPTRPDGQPGKPEDDKKKKEGGKSKEAPDKEKVEKARKEADEKAKKEAADKEKKRKEAKEKAKIMLDEQKKANEELNSWLSTILNTTKNAGKDIQQGAKDVADLVVPVVKPVIKEIYKNPGIIIDKTIDAVKIAGQGIVDAGKAAKDIITHPIDIGWETVKGTASDVKTIATETYGKAFVDMVKNPKKILDFIYNASGGEDLIMAMDPNRPLVNRSFHYGVAVYKTILNTMAGAGIMKGGVEAAKAVTIRGITSTGQYGLARNAPVFEAVYHQVDEMSKAGAKNLGVELTLTQKLKITTGLFLEWYKRRYD